MYKFRFQLMKTFFLALFPFQDFLLNQTYIARISFWFLETTIKSIYGLSLISRAPQDRIHTTVSKLFNFSFCIYMRTAKTSYSEKDIPYSVP